MWLKLQVPNRIPEKQTEFVAQVLMNLVRSKKPVVLVATKCDEANEVGVREIERLVNRKELKALNIPVIETSSHEGVNIDAAFFTLAQVKTSWEWVVLLRIVIYCMLQK